MFIKKLLNTKIGGQSTAEYLIILVLVSIGSIGVMSIFGRSVRQQLSNVVSAFTGSEGDMISVNELQKNAKEAKSRAQKGVTMKGIDSTEIKEFKGK